MLLVLFATLLASVANSFYVPIEWEPYHFVTYFNEATQDYVVLPASVQAPHGRVVAADALFNASFSELGWDYVHIATSKLFEDIWGTGEMYYAAGFTEGYLTANEIAAQMAVWTFRQDVLDWVGAMRKYMKKKVLENGDLDPSQQSSFWLYVGRVLKQIKGLADGYGAGGANRTLSEDDFFFWNYRFEIWEINAIITGDFSGRIDNADHCSALIKVTSDDLFVAHNSWMSYDQTLGVRHYKTYEFDSVVVFSGYPGQLHSGDDWYLTSNRLVAQETTYGVMNNELYKNVTSNSVPEFIRVMVANFGATNGWEWGKLFAENNSGTYNNQYMVVDMKLFSPGKRLLSGTLWLHEQLPGSVTSADVTNVLQAQSYWPSYNIPYLVRDAAGYTQMQKQEGSFWSYSNYSRAEIFKARHSGVKDLQGMKDIMRYNDYLNDPFSLIPNCSGTTTGKCVPPYSAMLSIASRGDLNPVGNASNYGPLFKYVEQRNHGAVDAKIASWSRLRMNGATLIMRGVVVMGPPDNISNVRRPFKWAESPWPGLKPSDGIETYEFAWVEFAFPVEPKNSGGQQKMAITVGIILACAILLLVVVWKGHIFGTSDDDEPEGLENDSLIEGQVQNRRPSAV